MAYRVDNFLQQSIVVHQGQSDDRQLQDVSRSLVVGYINKFFIDLVASKEYGIVLLS